MFDKLKPNEGIQEEKKKKPIYKRWWFIVLVSLFILVLITPKSDDTKKEETEEVSKETVDVKENYEISGNMKVDFKDDKMTVTVNSNVIDGSIFEVLVADGNLKSVSDYITIENGIGTKEFDVPQEWEVSYVSGIASMRFNSDEHPQPEFVKELYGEVGEKLEGDFSVENNLNGKNVNLEAVTVPYPTEQAVKDKLDELYNNSMNELIKLSNGIIVGIEIDSGIVHVKLSDVWYNSAEYEKERFAEQVSSTIKSILINTGKADSDDYISVYFYDTYGKELASPKMLGGYNIKQ